LTQKVTRNASNAMDLTRIKANVQQKARVAISVEVLAILLSVVELRDCRTVNEKSAKPKNC
jgi:hypothetical protein